VLAPAWAHEFRLDQGHRAIFLRQWRSRELDHGVDPDAAERLDVLREPATILRLRALIAQFLRRAAELECLDDVAVSILNSSASRAGQPRAVQRV
jgi:hypothetical protein